MKKMILGLILISLFTTGAAAEDEISFVELNHKKKLLSLTEVHDVFAAKSTRKAYYSYAYDSFSNWKTRLSGRFFNLEPAPVVRGLIDGVSAPEITQDIDSQAYEDQASEFAELTNFRASKGRVDFKLGERKAEDVLQKVYKNTYVVETLFSAVIDLPFESLDLDHAFSQDLAENIDYDHYHFQIPGSFVSNVLKRSHKAHETLQPERNYLLSVIDFREYGCSFMKNGMRDYFSDKPVEDRLANESIYLISEIKFNDETEMSKAESFFGRRPDGLISQEAIYADHLIKASKLYFAFYKEGAKTRVVLLSNLAMGKKFFTGKTGLVVKPYLFNGVGSQGAALAVGLDAVKGIKSFVNGEEEKKEDLSSEEKQLEDLFGAAQDAIDRKNSCDSGLALGLIKYSQNLFTEFSSYLREN